MTAKPIKSVHVYFLSMLCDDVGRILIRFYKISSLQSTPSGKIRKMFGGKTYSDARVVEKNPSDERNVFNSNQLLRSQPAYDIKESPGEPQLDGSTVPLTVSVKTGTQFFSNPE